MRSCAIQNNGGPGSPDGAWVVRGNQITHAGFPAKQPPHTGNTSGPGQPQRFAVRLRTIWNGQKPCDCWTTGHGIFAVSLDSVQILGNQISHGRGDAITAEGLHFVIANNLLSADGSNTSAVAVANSVDVQVHATDRCSASLSPAAC